MVSADPGPGAEAGGHRLDMTGDSSLLAFPGRQPGLSPVRQHADEFNAGRLSGLLDSRRDWVRFAKIDIVHMRNVVFAAVTIPRMAGFLLVVGGQPMPADGVVVADRKFAPRPGAPFITVQGARLKVFGQAPPRNNCLDRGAGRHFGQICSEVQMSRLGIREDGPRASNSAQAQLGVRDPARQGQQLRSLFVANDRERERLDLLDRAGSLCAAARP